MKILVTGGAGYIGSTLVRKLIEKGYDVTVLVRLIFGKESLKDIEDKVKLIVDDIRNVTSSHLKKVDVVIDMAALSNDPSGELDPQKTLDINYKGRAKLAKLAKKNSVGKYILASSCSVYGFQ